MKEPKTQSHLINIIRTTKDHHPNFVLFLGAGASATSQVKVVKEMLQEWRRAMHISYGGDQTREEYLKTQSWFNTSAEYSILFEKLYDQPSQRREYIESCITGATPSWGYIYLVNLIQRGTFNTIFTTNFDDLLNEACYSFSSDVRPIVCAHDSSIRFVRLASKRPKIIKVHGDFLFDNIKNTISELETLEQNTQEKFKQYASEFGFIFVGYGGNDRSVMDTLNNLLRFDGFFPHGVYWCKRRESKVPEQVDNLRRFNNFHIVDIDGFDQFFAELNEAMGFSLQPEMVDPYSALAKKLNKLIDIFDFENANPSNRIISRHIANLGAHIERATQPESSGPGEAIIPLKGSTVNMSIPYNLLSRIARQNGEFEKAFQFSEAEFEVRPSLRTLSEYFRAAVKTKSVPRIEEAMDEVKKASGTLLKGHEDEVNDYALVLMREGLFELAGKVLEIGKQAAELSDQPSFEPHYYLLNRLQIKKHLNQAFAENELQVLDTILAQTNDPFAKIGALTLLDRYSDAEAILKEQSAAMDLSFTEGWPILRWLIPNLQDANLKEIYSDYQFPGSPSEPQTA